ncbi:MAG: hypothetical protein IJQ12_03705 [Lachnospiraceae bacterium]|nr:hypothetical protein [Lachnospiraceae bacterium]
MRAQKGTFGYIRTGRKQTTAVTAVLLFLTLTLFFTGLFLYGSNRSVFSILAAVMALPTAVSAVRCVMFYRAVPCSREMYERIRAVSGGLYCMYDLCLTSKEANYNIACACVLFDRIACLTEDSALRIADAEKHIRLQIALSKYHDCFITVTGDPEVFLTLIEEMEEIRKERGADPYAEEQAWVPGTRQTMAGVLKSISL